MRYSRQEDLLKLASMMQGSAEGVSLQDIEATFKVGRRTAERMRDAVSRVYPQLDEIAGEHGQKRWRFPPGTLGRMEEPTIGELAAGHRAVAIACREGDLATAETLELLLAKVQAMFRADRRRRIAADLEAQLLADGVAFRPGPREKIAPEILSALREAILAGVMILADHRARASAKLSRDTRLGPIALLFGEGRQYLLAWSEYQDDLRLFALAESFGIWREEPQDVEWRFLPEVADEAAGYVFHPKQTVERLVDGSLMVRFRAGGRQEMAWYLARWGDMVEVTMPKSLPN